MLSHPFLTSLGRRWSTAGRAAEKSARVATARGPVPPPERQLADETEAFLAGSLAELVAAQGRSLPPWLLINRLAHADLDELRRVARGQAAPVVVLDAPPSHDRAWALAEEALVMHLLSADSDPAEIRRIQREDLVPLELALIRFTTVQALTLGEILAETLDVIDEHP